MLLEAVAAVTLGLLAGSGPDAGAMDQRSASLERGEQATTSVAGADGGVVDEARRANDGPGDSRSTEEDPDLARIPGMPSRIDGATREEPVPAEKAPDAAPAGKANGGVRAKNSLQSATQVTALRSPPF